MKTLLPILVLICAGACVGCRDKVTRQQVIVVHDTVPRCPGSVTVYKAGTNTLVALYADSEMTEPMVNPFTPVCVEGPSFTFWTSVSNLRIVERPEL